MSRVYSVWNPSRLEYDYYQAQGGLRDGVFADAPPKQNRRHRLGLTVEEAANALPASAKRAGGGELPVGTIAERKSPLGILDLSFDPLRLAIYAGVGYLVYKQIKR